MNLNKNKINYLFLLLVMLLATSNLMAQRQEADIDWGLHPIDYSREGRSGFQFLKLPVNARFAGMAGITTALGQGDASYSLANPASITDVKGLDLSFSSMNWIADIGYISGSIVKNFGRFGTLGLNYISVDYGDMERTEYTLLVDEAGESLGKTQPSYNLETVTGGDLSVGLSYARNVTDRLKFGVVLKYVQETLDDATTGNWALDVGTLYYTGVKTLRIAMLGQHFGPDAEFLGYDEQIQIPAQRIRLPQQLRFGAAIDLLEGKDGNPHLLTVATEFVHPNDGEGKVHVGLEYSFMNFMMFRSGYRFNYDEEGLTLGGGLRLYTGGYSVLFNYAYLDFGRLEQVHLFSIGLGRD